MAEEVERLSFDYVRLSKTNATRQIGLVERAVRPYTLINSPIAGVQ
jgi:hypothetical protein